MIRSPYVDLWEAHLLAGRVRADALAVLSRIRVDIAPFMRAVAQAAAAAAEIGRRYDEAMRAAAAALEANMAAARQRALERDRGEA